MVTNCVIHDTRLNGIKIQESFGRVMRNMIFSNIVMDRVNGPISIRLGGWKMGSNPWAKFDDSRWEEGRISDIRFDNIRANAVMEPGNKLAMFIAGAGRARNQHRGIRAASVGDLDKAPLHGRRGAHQKRNGVPGGGGSARGRCA